MDGKLEAGRRVSARLLPAEDMLDQALVKNAELRMAVVSAQRDFQLPSPEIQTLLSEIDASRHALAAARRNVRRAHVRILRARGEARMDESDFGCTRVCLQHAEPEQVVHQLAG